MPNKSTFIVILVVDGVKYCLHTEYRDKDVAPKGQSFLKIEFEGAIFVPTIEELHTAKLFFNNNSAQCAIETIVRSERARKFLAPKAPTNTMEWQKRLYSVELTPSEDL